jgi:DNA polymerase
MDRSTPGAPGVEAKTQLAEIAREVAACTACALAKTRTKTVPGDGSPQAEILFIGEAPGYHEDQQGRPFVGAAGQFLSELLASIGSPRLASTARRSLSRTW